MQMHINVAHKSTLLSKRHLCYSRGFFRRPDEALAAPLIALAQRNAVVTNTKRKIMNLM